MAEVPRAPVATQTAQAGTLPRPRGFDASEGTALDPLRNKTYDLNYPKTIPPLILPGLGVTSYR